MRLTLLASRMSHYLAAIKPTVAGMQSLDKNAFDVHTEVLAVRMKNTCLAKMLPALKSFMIRGYLQLPPVVGCDQPHDDYSLVRLDQTKIDGAAEFDTEQRPQIDELAGRFGADLTWCRAPLHLGYVNFQPTHIFDAILPGDMQFSSYSTVGHIIHVNLRDDMLPYKHIIGEVLLDKIAPCRTVVNKAREIGDSQYRHFAMELLAGEPDFVVRHKEGGCVYTFDFSKVYWNSRLSHEHERIVKQYLRKKGKGTEGKPTVVVYDCCAGVGPFALPAAKVAQCHNVLANDLNPDSYRYLCENINLNGVQSRVKAYNLDAADFIRDVLSSDLSDRLGQCSSSEPIEAHCLMNLPAFAVNFMPHYAGVLPAATSSAHLANLRFYVHCYCFTKNADEPQCAAKETVEEKLRFALERAGPSSVDSTSDYWTVHDAHHVRTVAGYKEMFCVTVALKPAFLTHVCRTDLVDSVDNGGENTVDCDRGSVSNGEAGDSEAKRIKLSQ